MVKWGKLLFRFCLGYSIFYKSQKRWFAIYLTTGESMLPTIEDGGAVLVCKSSEFVQRNLKRGDVVLCRSSVKPEELVIKRVAAMEWDVMPNTIEPINKYFPHADLPWVPRGYIWINGDNSDNSLDSRDYGPIPLGLVEGRVLYQLHPVFKKIHSGL